MENNAAIHAHSVNSVFEVRSVMGKSIIGLNATMIKRFSVAVAYFVDGLWRLRYRIVVTHQGGVLCFPLHKTLDNQNGVYSIPTDFDINTILVIGIAADALDSEVKLRVYANESGLIGKNFDGYVGSVMFDQFLDKATFSDNLVGRKHGKTVRFDRNLYQLTQPNQLENAPRFSFGDSWCANCLVVSERTNDSIQNYRTNVYGQVPMSMFKIRIENPNDELYILNKTSGIFEV